MSKMPESLGVPKILGLWTPTTQIIHRDSELWTPDSDFASLIRPDGVYSVFTELVENDLI